MVLQPSLHLLRGRWRRVGLFWRDSRGGCLGFGFPISRSSSRRLLGLGRGALCCMHNFHRLVDMRVERGVQGLVAFVQQLQPPGNHPQLALYSSQLFLRCVF